MGIKWITPQEGVIVHIRKATFPGTTATADSTASLPPERNNGSYLVDSKPIPPTAYAQDKANAEPLWDFSDELVGEKSPSKWTQ